MLSVTYNMLVKQLVKGIRNMGNWAFVCNLFRKSQIHIKRPLPVVLVLKACHLLGIFGGKAAFKLLRELVSQLRALKRSRSE